MSFLNIGGKGISGKISPKDIDSDAMGVIRRLNHAGYTAYLVGGGVRDLLLGRTPKDFDVVTDAKPNQIRRLFRNAFLIGRRFRLALIVFGEKQIETATFRKTPPEDIDTADDNRIGALYQSDDNLFGTPEQDAKRRDFTVNALFYDVSSSSIVDYVNGMSDLKRRILRSIGDPNIRFREDPVRMLRAIRLSTRLGFKIHSDSMRAIAEHSGEISQVSPPRLFEEVMRLFSFANSENAFKVLWNSGLMDDLLPATADCIRRSGRRKALLWKYLSALDSFVGDFVLDKKSPYCVYENSLRMAVLLAPQFIEECSRLNPDGETSVMLREIAECVIDETFVRRFSSKSWRIPKILAQSAADLLFWRNPHKFDRKKKRMIYSSGMYPTLSMFWKICAKAEGDADAPDAIRKWDEGFEEYVASGKTNSGEKTRGNNDYELFPVRRRSSSRAHCRHPEGQSNRRHKNRPCEPNKNPADAVSANGESVPPVTRPDITVSESRGPEPVTVHRDANAAFGEPEGNFA